MMKAYSGHHNYSHLLISLGDHSGTVVKVPRYKSEGRWFDPMEFFIDINPSDRTMALGSTQPLTEMSTRIISWG
jgi:hypothetical protein